MKTSITYWIQRFPRIDTLCHGTYLPPPLATSQSRISWEYQSSQSGSSAQPDRDGCSSCFPGIPFPKRHGCWIWVTWLFSVCRRFSEDKTENHPRALIPSLKENNQQDGIKNQKTRTTSTLNNNNNNNNNNHNNNTTPWPPPATTPARPQITSSTDVNTTHHNTKVES